MDKLTALRVLRRVVERESFTRAARDLGLSNAAVSKNVRELEGELGAPLLQRTTRRLHLTPVGETYYQRAVAILDALAEADRGVKELATASPRGLLRVAAPMSLGLALVAPAASTFLARHPEVTLELEMNDRVVDVVREGFDVCVRGGALGDSSLVARKLARIERVVVASPGYLARAGEPRTPDDLAKHRCLVYSLSASPSRWSFVKGATKKVVDVDGPLRANSSLALVHGVLAGLGLAFVPAATVERELAERRVVSLLDEWKAEPQALHAVYARHREASPLVRAFVDHLVEAFTSHPSPPPAPPATRSAGRRSARRP